MIVGAHAGIDDLQQADRLVDLAVELAQVLLAIDDKRVHVQDLPLHLVGPHQEVFHDRDLLEQPV